jgi:hypothetical protein
MDRRADTPELVSIVAKGTDWIERKRVRGIEVAKD